MSRRGELVHAIRAQESAGAPPPIVTVEEFFEGNADEASIGCNLSKHPGLARFYEVLRAIRDRSDVQDVWVEIWEVMEGEDEWPFAERIYILSEAQREEVASWLVDLQPDEIDEGWSAGPPARAPELLPGMRVYGAWWD